MAGPQPQNFWFSRSGGNPRICISSKFPGEAAAASLVRHFEKHSQTWLTRFSPSASSLPFQPSLLPLPHTCYFLTISNAKAHFKSPFHASTHTLPWNSPPSPSTPTANPYLRQTVTFFMLPERFVSISILTFVTSYPNYYVYPFFLLDSFWRAETMISSFLHIL